MTLAARLAALLLLCASSTALADYDRLISAFVGSLQLDDQKGDLLDAAGDPVNISFPSLPSAGLEGEYRYGGGSVAWGLNPGGSIAWKNSGTRVSGGFSSGTGGVIRVDIDNALFLGELHLGGYLRGRLGESVTAYVAAGPMVTYGRMSIESENPPSVEPADGAPEFESSDSSDFGFGYYARAGIDLSIRGEQAIGLGVRYMSSKLDLDKSVGDIDIEGPQVVLSYTVPL